MTNDDFLDAWAPTGGDSRSISTGWAGRVERRRLRTRLALIAKAAATGIALFSGAWFVWLALKGAPPIFALAGIVLLIALPLMLLELAGMARSLRIGHDDLPAGILRRARDQATKARHLLWLSRAGALLLGASAVGLLCSCNADARVRRKC